MSFLTFVLFLLPGWSLLPRQPSTHGGYVARLTHCVGCKGQGTLKNPLVYECDFRHRGFPFPGGSGVWARPCGVAYHRKCIRAGPPFNSRLPKSRGLSFPSNLIVPHFICECCQVRCLLRAELKPTGRDSALLMLERVRMIDVVSSWKETTSSVYTGQLRYFQRFTKWSGIPTLVPTVLKTPPESVSFGLAYAQLRDSVTSRDVRLGGQLRQKAYNSGRGLRSAANMFYQLDAQAAFPTQAMFDVGGNTCRITQGTLPTAALMTSLLQSGMKK